MVKILEHYWLKIQTTSDFNEYKENIHTNPETMYNISSIFSSINSIKSTKPMRISVKKEVTIHSYN